MKRRHLLAGAAALPFAGMAAQAGASDDPAVRTFQAWHDAWTAHAAWFAGRADWADDDPEENRLHEA